MNLPPEVAAYLEKSRHALQVAQKLLEDEEYADAGSKAYYAMFYAAQALLRAHGFLVVKHSAVASVLGREFAKTGRLDARLHRMLLHARRVRELADYSIITTVDAATARQVVANGKVFVAEIDKMLATSENGT